MSKTMLLALLIVSLAAPLSTATQLKQPVISGKRYPRLIIRNAMIVDGNGTPASGPKDIVVEGNTIAEIVSLDPVALREGRAKRPAGDVEFVRDGHMRESARAFERARDVAISCGVFGEEDIARTEAMTRAVAQLDFPDACGDEDELALRRPVLPVHVRRRRVAEEEA